MPKDKEPSSAKNHLNSADSAYMRARQLLEEASETRRQSVERLRISSSANLPAVKLQVIAPVLPANLEQSDPLPLPTVKGRDMFTIIRRRRY